jgi:hypothetical protein
MTTPSTTLSNLTKRTRRRRGLAVGLVIAGAVAAAPGVATLAGFTAQDVNRDNTIESGTLDIAFGQAERHFDVHNMKPGDTTTQKVQVTNTGALTDNYTLDAVNVQGPLDDVLRATVLGPDGRVARNVKLSELKPIVGQLQAGESQAYEVSVSWPENAPEVDNNYQATGVTFDLQVDAGQLAGTDVANGANAGN